jgi:hypothetical protein
MYETGREDLFRSSGTTGDKKETFSSTFPSTSRVKILFVDVYSKDFWLTVEPTSFGSPNQT